MSRWGRVRVYPTTPPAVSTVCGIIWLSLFAALVSCVPSGEFAFAQPTPIETPTRAPTKFALAVESATPTPKPTPTSTPTVAPTSTAVPTRTTKPTRTFPTPTASTTPSPSPTVIDVGETYSTLSVYPSPSDHSTDLVELNIGARGFISTTGALSLIDIVGPADAGAPQLAGLFPDGRVPPLSRVYQIDTWDWDCGCQGPPLADPSVSVAGFAVTAGETIRVPRSSYYIANDFQALVLYADSNRVTLNYTRTGNPVRGYTLYLESLAVDSHLLSLYQRTNGAGRVELPALQAGQAIGLTEGTEIQAAIRDAGGFMDPRSRKDWWHGM